jgi:hypothetical protein
VFAIGDVRAGSAKRIAAFVGLPSTSECRFGRCSFV